jgi:hypothetical protein
MELMSAKLKLVLALTASIVLLQGCGKSEQAATPSTAASTAVVEPAGSATPVVESAIAKDSDTPPATTFSSDVPKLYAFFKSTGTHKGDTFRAVWIAEDVGAAAPKETKIDEGTLAADSDNFSAAFSLSKPNNGWPVGKYRTEIHLGDKLASTSKFSIE